MGRHVDAAQAYARRVQAGEIPVCKWARLAIDRQLDDLVRDGKLRHYGVSVERIDEALAALAAREAGRRVHGVDGHGDEPARLGLRVADRGRGQQLAQRLDGALVAHALILAGQSELSRNFFRYAARAIHKNGYFLHKYTPSGHLASSWHPWTLDGKPVAYLKSPGIAHAVKMHTC